MLTVGRSAPPWLRLRGIVALLGFQLLGEVVVRLTGIDIPGPVGVGIIVYLDTLRDDALPLAAGLWVSWLVGFTVTALVVALLLRLTHRSGR